MSGLRALQEATGDAGFDELPEAVRYQITHKEWLWLSDGEKARYVQNQTEPESDYEA